MPSKRSFSSFQGSGLDVQIVQLRNGPLAVSAMGANEAQFYTTLATGSSLGSDGVLKGARPRVAPMGSVREIKRLTGKIAHRYGA